MTRLLTALVLLALVLSGVFLLPSRWFLLLAVMLTELAALEVVRLGRSWAPGAPLRLLLVTVPLAVLVLAAGLSGAATGLPPGWLALALATALGVGMGVALLAGRTPVRESLPALGLLAFGTVYLAVPVTAVWSLQRSDPWLVFLLLAIVAVNDSAAFYVGRRFGRRKLSPHVSPNKSWEGSAAGVAGAVAATAVWSRLVLETWEPRLVLLGVLVAVAGQCGDLVESMLKRGAGVKDSGTLLPGHGGVLDRVDAFLFAAPVLLLGLHGFGLGRLLE